MNESDTVHFAVKFEESDGPIGIKWFIHPDSNISVGEIIAGSAASTKNIHVGDIVDAVNGDVTGLHPSGMSPHQVLMQHVYDRPIEFSFKRSIHIDNPKATVFCSVSNELTELEHSLIYPHGDRLPVHRKTLYKRGYANVVPVFCQSIVDTMTDVVLLLFDDTLLVASQQSTCLIVLLRLALIDCTIDCRMHCADTFEIIYCNRRDVCMSYSALPCSVLVECMDSTGHPGRAKESIASTHKRQWIRALQKGFARCVTADEMALVGWEHRRVTGTIHSAAVCVDVDLLQTLLDIEADVNEEDSNGYTALLLVCVVGTAITATSARPAVINCDTATAVFCVPAAEGPSHGQTEADTSDTSMTPVITAACNGKDGVASIRLLPCCVADDDYQCFRSNSRDPTPLHLPSQTSSLTTFLEVLLSVDSIDTERTSPEGFAALHILSREWRYDLVEIALRSGKVNVNARGGPHSCTPLQCAVDSLHTKLPQFYTQACVRREELGDVTDGSSPLHFAGPMRYPESESDCLATVRVLLQYGASPNVRNDFWSGEGVLLQRLIEVMAEGGHEQSPLLCESRGRLVDAVAAIVMEVCLYGGRLSAEMISQLQLLVSSVQLERIRHAQKHWQVSNAPLRCEHMGLLILHRRSTSITGHSCSQCGQKATIGVSLFSTPRLCAVCGGQCCTDCISKRVILRGTVKRVCDGCYNFVNNMADLLVLQQQQHGQNKPSFKDEEALLRLELDAVTTDSLSCDGEADEEDDISGADACGVYIRASTTTASPNIGDPRRYRAAKDKVVATASSDRSPSSDRDAALINKFKARKAERDSRINTAPLSISGRKGCRERHSSRSAVASADQASPAVASGAFSDTMWELLRRGKLLTDVGQNADHLAESSREFKSNSELLLEKTRNRAKWWGV